MLWGNLYTESKRTRDDGLVMRGGGPMAFQVVSKLVSTTLFVALALPAALAAANPAPESGQPQPPSPQQTPPTAPPSRIDPGIQKAPDTVPNPKSIVPPPVVDPKMAIDPERPGGPAHPKPPSPTDKPPMPPR